MEAASATFVPTRKPRKRQDETSTLGPSIQLPSGLSYLQPAFDELLATPPEDLGQEASLFLPLLEDALRQRLQGVSFADAEECIEAVHQELESWLKEQSTEIPAASFILDWLKNPYIMMEMFGPDEEP